MRRWGCPSQKLPNVSRQANERKRLDGQDRKAKPHEMELQVPRRVHTEMSKKGAVRATADSPRRGVSGVGAAQGEFDRGGTSDGRSRAHDDRDTAEVRGIERGGVHQGQKRDSPGAGALGAEEELCGAMFLGSGLLCLGRRTG